MSHGIERGCSKDLFPLESGPWFDAEYSHNMCALRQLLLIRVAYESPISFGNFSKFWDNDISTRMGTVIAISDKVYKVAFFFVNFY